MTVLAPSPPRPVREPTHVRRGVVRWVTSTDHKDVGRAYVYTSLFFLLLAGGLAMLMRTQLLSSDHRLISAAVYEQLFTIHGSLMMYAVAVPFLTGLASAVVPLQIGAPGVAFPRLNALTYWMYTCGGLLMVAGFLTRSGAAAFAWVAFPPLSESAFSPGAGEDLWIVAVVLLTLSAVLAYVNLLTTVFCLRAPGMTMLRLPLFTWNVVASAFMVLIGYPVLVSAEVMLWFDRHYHTHIFTVVGGGVPLVWQHLFWFFGHPVVYVIFLPAIGVLTDIIAHFSRRPVFGYKIQIVSSMAIAVLSPTVWAHHMFTTGAVLLPFFSAVTLMIAIPTVVKYFSWIGNMWYGALRMDTPMLYSVGFLVTFMLGGITGIIIALPPVNFYVHDTYYIVAHFHATLIPSLLFAGFAGLYYYYPKLTGRMLSERLGKLQFWIQFWGYFLLVVPMFVVGLHGMPRRVATYAESPGWATLNQIESVGAYLIGIATAVLLLNLWVSWRRPVPAAADAWGDGPTLEWATPSPPPSHNFLYLPPILSERPLWDARHGEPDEPQQNPSGEDRHKP